MTYAGKGHWAYLVVLAVMVVILLNAEGCAELILRNKYVVHGQDLSYNQTWYKIPDNPEKDNNSIVVLP